MSHLCIKQQFSHFAQIQLILIDQIILYNIFSDGPLPAVLQEVDLPIINNTECEAMYEKAGFREHIPHIFICAGYKEGGKDSCEVGDGW